MSAPARATVLRVERISERSAFEALHPLWNSLLARSKANCLFLTWEWLSTWWKVFEEDRRLCILAVYDEAELVGIAPLQERTVRHFGMSYRRIEFLATGENEQDEICSEYLDFILADGREEEVLEAILKYFDSTREAWDEIVLQKMRREANALTLTQLCHRLALQCQSYEDGHSSYLPLPENWETLLQGLGKSFRQNLRNLRNRCEKSGAVFQVVEKQEEFESAFQTLIALHQERWTQLGQPGVFSSEKFTRFHRDVCQLLLPLGHVRLFQLSLEGQPVASLYTFVYNGQILNYQNGLRPNAYASYSPGTVLLSHALQHSIECGLGTWDFLGGGADYKTRWSGREQDLIAVRLSRRGLKQSWYALAAGAVGMARRVKRTFPRNNRPDRSPYSRTSVITSGARSE